MPLLHESICAIDPNLPHCADWRRGGVVGQAAVPDEGHALALGEWEPSVSLAVALLVLVSIQVAAVDMAMAERAAAVRARTSLKLPDAYALAVVIGLEHRGRTGVRLASFDKKVHPGSAVDGHSGVVSGPQSQCSWGFGSAERDFVWAHG